MRQEEPARPRATDRRRRIAGATLAASLAVTITGIAAIGLAPDRFDAVRVELDDSTSGSSSDGGPSGAGVYRVDTDDPVVFVTIDDGHHPSSEALDIIREHEMPVSVFLNEDPVVYNHSYFAEYVEMGNYVHSHTLSHPDLTRLDTARQENEICGMVDILDDRYSEAGHVGSLLRPPYGASNEATAAAAQRCGLDTIVHWTVTAEDGRLSFAAGDGLQPGDIILTHFTEDLPDNLDRIRELADDSGLTIARLEDRL
ncbi:polysaccharide deacetylase family protein [Streptomonospora salina]|uniref:Peptidoglycan/xylan/chitin deacetylase (PgdA/CDA1 family) n=1 Tax=Streptomonospora salina TaxID=104205 RepID=A0A841EKH0_9ACTN|nr:polysaccharide deacetylase family protein [Streptomonospora salina]MBB5999911.1 peptidoglycan/xylan/chitin deacetylase (PgdA/CDA1 family) [Streptomonospora salina]